MKKIKIISFLILLFSIVKFADSQETPANYEINTNNHVYQIQNFAAKIDIQFTHLRYGDTAAIYIIQHAPDGENITAKHWIVYQDSEIKNNNDKARILVYEVSENGEKSLYDSWSAYRDKPDEKELIIWAKKGFSTRLENTGYFSAQYYFIKGENELLKDKTWFRIIRNSKNTTKRPLLVTDKYLHVIEDSIEVHFAYRDMPDNCVIRVYKYNKDGNNKYYKNYQLGNKTVEYYSAEVAGDGEGSFTFYQPGNFEIHAYFRRDGLKVIHASERFYIYNNFKPGYAVPYISTAKYVNRFNHFTDRFRVIFQGFPANAESTVELHKTNADGGTSLISTKKVKKQGKLFYKPLSTGNYEFKVYFERDNKFLRASSRFYVTHSPYRKPKQQDKPGITTNKKEYCKGEPVIADYWNFPKGIKKIKLYRYWSSNKQLIESRNVFGDDGNILYQDLDIGIYKVVGYDLDGNKIAETVFKVIDCDKKSKTVIKYTDTTITRPPDPPPVDPTDSKSDSTISSPPRDTIQVPVDTIIYTPLDPNGDNKPDYDPATGVLSIPDSSVGILPKDPIELKNKRDSMFIVTAQLEYIIKNNKPPYVQAYYKYYPERVNYFVVFKIKNSGRQILIGDTILTKCVGEGWILLPQITEYGHYRVKSYTYHDYYESPVDSTDFWVYNDHKFDVDTDKDVYEMKEESVDVKITYKNVGRNLESQIEILKGEINTVNYTCDKDRLILKNLAVLRNTKPSEEYLNKKASLLKKFYVNPITKRGINSIRYYVKHNFDNKNGSMLDLFSLRYPDFLNDFKRKINSTYKHVDDPVNIENIENREGILTYQIDKPGKYTVVLHVITLAWFKNPGWQSALSAFCPWTLYHVSKEFEVVKGKEMEVDCPLAYKTGISAEEFLIEFVQLFFQDPKCCMMAGAGPEEFNKLTEQEIETGIQMLELLTAQVKSKYGGFKKVLKTKEVSVKGNTYNFDVTVEYRNGKTETLKDVFTVFKSGDHWRGKVVFKIK